MKIRKNTRSLLMVYVGCVMAFFFLNINACSTDGGQSPSPMQPAVRISNYWSALGYFELPKITDDDASQLERGKPIAEVTLEVTTENQFLNELDIAFDMRIGGQGESYRLNVKSNLTEVPEESITVCDLYPGEPQYFTAYLYIQRDAYDVLAAIEEATTCTVEIVIDPYREIALSADSDTTVQLAIEYLPDNIFAWEPDEFQYEKYFGGDGHKYSKRYNYSKPIKYPPGDGMEISAAMKMIESADPFKETEYTIHAPWTAARHLHQYIIDTLVYMSEGPKFKPFTLECQISFNLVRNNMLFTLRGFSNEKQIVQHILTIPQIKGKKTVFDYSFTKGNLETKVIERNVHWYEDLTFTLTFKGTYSFEISGWVGPNAPNDPREAALEIDHQVCLINLDVVPSMEKSGYAIKADSHTTLIDWRQQGYYFLRNLFPSEQTKREEAWHRLDSYYNDSNFKSGEGTMEMVRINKNTHEMYKHTPSTYIYNVDKKGNSYTDIDNQWKIVNKPTYTAD